MRILCISLKVEPVEPGPLNACFDATMRDQDGTQEEEGRKGSSEKKLKNEARATPSSRYTVFKVVVPLA